MYPRWNGKLPHPHNSPFWQDPHKDWYMLQGGAPHEGSILPHVTSPREVRHQHVNCALRQTGVRSKAARVKIILFHVFDNAVLTQREQVVLTQHKNGRGGAIFRVTELLDVEHVVTDVGLPVYPESFTGTCLDLLLVLWLSTDSQGLVPIRFNEVRRGWCHECVCWGDVTYWAWDQELRDESRKGETVLFVQWEHPVHGLHADVVFIWGYMSNEYVDCGIWAVGDSVFSVVFCFCFSKQKTKKQKKQKTKNKKAKKKKQKRKKILFLCF